MLVWIEKYRKGSEDGFRDAIDLLSQRYNAWNKIRGKPSKEQTKLRGLFLAQIKNVRYYFHTAKHCMGLEKEHLHNYMKIKKEDDEMSDAEPIENNDIDPVEVFKLKASSENIEQFKDGFVPKRADIRINKGLPLSMKDEITKQRESLLTPGQVLEKHTI